MYSEKKPSIPHQLGQGLDRADYFNRASIYTTETQDTYFALVLFWEGI